MAYSVESVEMEPLDFGKRARRQDSLHYTAISSTYTRPLRRSASGLYFCRSRSTSRWTLRDLTRSICPDDLVGNSSDALFVNTQ